MRKVWEFTKRVLLLLFWLFILVPLKFALDRTWNPEVPDWCNPADVFNPEEEN